MAREEEVVRFSCCGRRVQAKSSPLLFVLAAGCRGGPLFAGSLLFTTVAFPSYFSDLQGAHTEMLKSAGLSEGEIKTQVAAAAAMQTPFMNAISGVVGTVVTGAVVSAIAGAFLRKK